VSKTSSTQPLHAVLLRILNGHYNAGAASRWIEHQRHDSLFEDLLSYKLAGEEERSQPMGEWIMVPRTRFGDDLARSAYANNGTRQLVMLGAGMDARAYRLHDLPELHVFEVDQQTTFDVKEPLLAHEKLAVASRAVVSTEFSDRGRWADDLIASGYDSRAPSVWLLEGLMMYLKIDDAEDLMRDVGRLSAPGSVVFHDACSASYLHAGVVVGGAPFIGGSDEYARLWATHGGFTKAFVRDFRSVSVDRRNRRVTIDEGAPEATPSRIAGRDVVLFVVTEK